MAAKLPPHAQFSLIRLRVVREENVNGADAPAGRLTDSAKPPLLLSRRITLLRLALHQSPD
ncbi:MAG: hypothetical protein K1X90_04745 [Candidatus Kapabacteria bacterium]|nr:hypothetical protein [Candidatus Kapabacteria bacterium]